MDKYIPALIIFDKAKTFFFIEPFYFTFCQSLLPSFLDFSPLSVKNSTNKKNHPGLYTLSRLWFIFSLQFIDTLMIPCPTGPQSPH